MAAVPTPDISNDLIQFSDITFHLSSNLNLTEAVEAVVKYLVALQIPEQQAYQYLFSAENLDTLVLDLFKRKLTG